MEKKLENMTLTELYEFKLILNTISEKYSKIFSDYSTNGIIDKVQNVSDKDKNLLIKCMKNNKLISKVEGLIEEKVSKYYD